MTSDVDSVLIIGGGPAGMRAAEVASALLLRDATAGEVKAATVLCDAQGSFGRKFLIAGRGGLNLTHSEPIENFPDRYGAECVWRHDLLLFNTRACCAADGARRITTG